MCDRSIISRREFGRLALAGAAGVGLGGSLPVTAEAQVFPVLCSWAGSGHVGLGLARASPVAEQQMRDVMLAIQLRLPMQIYRGGVPNAAASVMRGVPTIIYNPDFLNGLARCDPVAALSVIAHEVGHHANLDTSWAGRFRHSWQRELGADWVSGLAMKRMGVSLNRAMNGINCSFGPFSPGSPSHPDSQSRLRAIRDGWVSG